MTQVFVGLDLGTSGMKAVATAEDGEIVADARSGYETGRPKPGRAEQDPADWMRSAAEVIASIASQVPTTRWAGIGLAGMIPTLVTADDDAQPVGPAITWEDDRAEDEGDAFRAAAGADLLYRRTGQRVDGRYLLPMFRWLDREEPERTARVRWVLSAKDLVFSWLTGETWTDPSTATGFGCYELETGTWAADLAGDLLARLPAVRPATSTAALRREAAGGLGLPPGLPVTLGAADSVAGALALGARSPGDCVSLWGTSTVILGVGSERVVDPAHRCLVTPLALEAGWGIEMDLVSTGSAIAWVASLLGADGEEAVLELGAQAPAGAEGLTFLPFLGHGEQGALWDAALRGTLAGLTLAHSREDVARALLEGIVVEFRRCIAVLGEIGVPPREIRAAGGAIGSRALAGMLSDATGCVLTRWPAEHRASAIGASLLAAVSAGAEVDAFRHREPLDRVEPNDAARAEWEAISQRHDEVLGAIGRHPV